MNFLSLEYFLKILSEGNFSKAARNLNVSQQSLSEHVRKLETDLGVPLLRRSSDLTLTVEGECFADGARKILLIKENMIKDILDVTNKRRKKIAIGIAPGALPDFLPKLLDDYSRQFPDFQYSIVIRHDFDIERNMSGIDLYIREKPFETSFEEVPICAGWTNAVVVRSSLLDRVYAARRSEIEELLVEESDLRLLEDLPFVLPLDPQGRIRSFHQLAFEAARIVPKVGFQSESPELNAYMCKCGLGAYFGSAEACRRILGSSLDSDNESLLFFTLNTPTIRSGYSLIYEKGKRLHGAEKGFIELAKATHKAISG